MGEQARRPNTPKRSEAGHRQVVARLANAQKSNRGAGAYSRLINRPLGRQLAAISFRLGLTPNQVSVISAGFSLAAIVALALVRPTWQLAVLVTVGLVLGYAFDSADGQVARLRGGGTPAGEWLDHVIDAAKISCLHAAVLISWYRFFDLSNAAWLLVPLGFAAVAAVFYFALTLSDMLRRIASARAGGAGVATASVDPNEAAPMLRSLLVLPNDYGLLCLAMLLLNVRTAFIAIYSLLLAANVVFLLVGCGRWYREMQHL
jgi:phosphatidylglycerophosphate synthase